MTDSMVNPESRSEPSRGLWNQAAALRLGVLVDYPEEGWASMDLCGEMLVGGLNAMPGQRVEATRLLPVFRHRFSRLGARGRNVDRLLNRMRYYPRWARAMSGGCDYFHVVDHSYSQLVHELPRGRVGVYCHDLDTFKCLLDPKADPRPRWFRGMTRRILTGMQQAEVLFYSTQGVKEQIIAHGLFDPRRLVQAPLGVAPEFTPEAAGQGIDAEGAAVWKELGLPNDAPFILHVGSCIPRKRIDVLLDVFAALAANRPDLRLVQAGGEWTGDQRRQLEALGIATKVFQRRGLNRRELAHLFRRAAVVLQPSEAEGFGLPVIEALACGAIVVASDLPVLREVGGDAAIYCAVGDVGEWARRVGRVLNDPATAPGAEMRDAQARRYSWENHCTILAETYLRLDKKTPSPALPR